MKKYVWFLIAAAFAVAIFAMVGCKPAETPAASPSPSPTVAPTPDTKCPQPVSTVVQSLYNPVTGDNSNKIKVIITFDEPIAGSVDCIQNPAYWTVTVANDTRYDAIPTDTIGPSGDVTVKVDSVVLSTDKKKITITGTVTESDVSGFNYGLICDEESQKAYRAALDPDKDGKAANGASVTNYATVADLIKWQLSSWCKVYDELGNACCGYKGEACCSPVCEPVTPPSGCPL